MTTFTATDGASAYPMLIEHVLQNGVWRTARGMRTLDVGPVMLRLDYVDHSLPLGTGRKINRRIAAAEALQLIGGFSLPDLLFAASRNFHQFAEPNGSFWGAYGVRIGDQLDHVVRKIQDDCETRQAVATLWDPTLDNTPGKRDYPCTIALTFGVVNDKLELHTVMRSQDVWLGTPYDWFQFTQLQQTIARLLDLPPGPYYHTTLSTHLYEQRIDTAKQIHFPPPLNDREWQPTGVIGTSVTHVRHNARLLVDDPDPTVWTAPTHKWYARMLNDWKSQL